MKPSLLLPQLAQLRLHLINLHLLASENSTPEILGVGIVDGGLVRT